MVKQVEILKGALAKLERDGWGQHFYGTADGPNCVVGACIYAGDIAPYANIDKRQARLWAVIGKAAGLKRKSNQSWWGAVTEWNDAKGRTADQVKRVLRKAIRALERGK